MAVSRPRPKVLVVEDDAQLAHLYTTALTLRGIAAKRAADGFGALQSVEQYRPDLILLDLAMPRLDGYTVLRELASNRTTSNIPVIVVTGTDAPAEMPHALMVLKKPCDPEHVARVIADHLPGAPAS